MRTKTKAMFSRYRTIRFWALLVIKSYRKHGSARNRVPRLIFADVWWLWVQFCEQKSVDQFKNNQCEIGLPLRSLGPRASEALRRGSQSLGKGRVGVYSISLIDLKTSRRIYTPRGQRPRRIWLLHHTIWFCPHTLWFPLHAIISSPIKSVCSS